MGQLVEYVYSNYLPSPVAAVLLSDTADFVDCVSFFTELSVISLLPSP